MPVLEHINCGLDIGTTSVGWGLIDSRAKIILPLAAGYGAGVWKFDPVEEKAQNKWKSKSAERGAVKRTRRRLGRKAWRLEQVRDLFAEQGLIESGEVGCLFHREKTALPCPWQLREEALTRVLSGEELFRALYHIAGHRAYEANSKSGEEEELRQLGDNIEEKKGKPSKKGKNAQSYGSQLKSLTNAIEDSGLTPAGYFRMAFGPSGQARHKEGHDDRFRGLDGRYDRLIKRRLLKNEIDRIFEQQRALRG